MEHNLRAHSNNLFQLQVMAVELYHDTKDEGIKRLADQIRNESIHLSVTLERLIEVIGEQASTGGNP